jgi:ubiquinone/menaquinone biosynthesis C-methylase UbiE
MNDEKSAWDADYKKRGHLWGGAMHPLPLLAAGSRVLELGCGNGKTLAFLRQRGYDMTAIDFSKRAVQISRQTQPALPPAHFIVADARALPLIDNTFDAAISFHLLGHMHKPDRIITAYEIYRVLKPGGELFFCDFSTGDFRNGRGSKTEDETFRRGSGICTHYFTSTEVCNLLFLLEPVSVTTASWPMKVRGTIFERSEIRARFIKNQKT